MYHEATLNGKRIAYTDFTVFHVQVGKGSKGGYKDRYTFVGPRSFEQAVGYYNGINIGRGYKKLLCVPAFNKPFLAREAS